MKVRIMKCNTLQKLPIVLYISRVKLQAQMLTSSAPYKSFKFLIFNNAKKFASRHSACSNAT
jgi:hypothetical protein